MKKTLLLLFALAAFYANAQTSCAGALPFCAGGVAGVTFPATTSTPEVSAESGPDYTCLGSEPNPAWYYVQISQSGTLTVLIAGQTASGGSGYDVDFTCWGPFSSPFGNCDSLTSRNTVGCSYSSSYTETLNITNAQVGQYYMVLITNFSNQQQNIVFTQIGGNAATNCQLVSNNTSICAGSSATIIAKNTSSLTNASYSMNPGGLTSSTGTFIVNPTVTTNYTLFITGTGNGGSSLTQTAVSSVTVNPQPLTAPTVTQTSCTSTVNAINLGLTFVGSANPSYTVNWQAPAPLGASNGTQTVVNGGIAAGIYTAVITATGGCQATAIVTINPIPAPSVFSITPVGGNYTVTCAQPTVVLTGSAANYTYTWNNGIIAPLTGQTASFVTQSIGHWSVTGTDTVSRCSSVHLFTISVDQVAPTSSVSPGSQVINCGIGVVATATGVALSPTTNVTHIWISPCAPTSSIMSGGQVSIFSPCINGANGTNTFVLVNNINGCSTIKTITVTSTNTYPTFSLVGTYTIGCNTTSLTAVTIASAQAGSGGQVTYTVLPPNYGNGTSYGTSFSLETYTFNTPGTYTFIVRDNTSLCETRIPVAIIQNTFGPNIQALAPTYTLSCFTPSIHLAAFSTASTPLSYNWTFQNGGNPNTNSNQTITVATGTAPVTSTIVNTYTLQITDQNNACVSTSIVPIYQNVNPPTASIAVQSNIITCSTPSVILNNASASNVQVPPFTRFQPQIGFMWAGPTPQLPDSNKSTYNAFVPGTYTMVTKDQNNGCVGTATTLILDGRIYPVIQTNTLVALDCDVATSGGVQLAATVQGLSSGQVSAVWQVPQPPPNIQNPLTLTLTTDGAGFYKLSVTTNSNGCSVATTVKVVNGVLNGGFTPDKETGFAPLTVNFTNNSSSTSSVTGTSSITSVWSFGNGTTKTTTTNVSTSAVYTAPGTYTVTMFASKGNCRDTIVKVITVDIPSKLVVPNVFTPNGDGSNDVFFVQAANLTDINCQIFDRWGNKIYDLDSNTGNIAWDGKNQSGHEAPDGTYFYTIKATGKDGQSYNTKGTVSLYR